RFLFIKVILTPPPFGRKAPFWRAFTAHSRGDPQKSPKSSQSCRPDEDEDELRSKRALPSLWPVLRCVWRARWARSSDERSGQDDFVALLKGDNGFFPVGRTAGLVGALASEFAAHIQGVDSKDLDLEQFLNGLPN